MTRVFLCHASEDKLCAEEIYNRLQSQGFSPWMDKRDLIPGQVWEQEILRVLGESEFILIFFSHNSVTKQGFVQREFKVALDAWEQIPEGTIHTIPVRLDDCEIPQRFKKFQWVDLFEENGFEKVIQALNLGLSQRSQLRHQKESKSQGESTLYTSRIQNTSLRMDTKSNSWLISNMLLWIATLLFLAFNLSLILNSLEFSDERMTGYIFLTNTSLLLLGSFISYRDYLKPYMIIFFALILQILISIYMFFNNIGNLHIMIKLNIIIICSLSFLLLIVKSIYNKNSQ